MTGPPALFLLGPPRSGSSLLYKALCLHPGAAWISSYVRRAPAVPVLAVLNRLTTGRRDRRRDVWFGGGANAYVYGSGRGLGDRLFPMPVEGEPVFARAHGEPDRLRRAAVAVVRWSGGSVLVSKRIANNQRIPLLHKAFPDARFVLLVRDGRATASSLSTVDWWPDSIVPWYGGTPRMWAGAGFDPWELCARTWVEELADVETGLTDLPVAQQMTLRYEDFVADPVPTLRRVAAFGGLPPHRAWEDELAALSFPNRNDAWRARMGTDVVDRVTRWQEPALRTYGYLP